MGHRPRGLQRRRRGVGLPPARPRPVQGLSVGGGRTRRVQRHRAAAVPGPGAVERARPDPQGAPVRADRRRGQPRRGRQGVLVVPRRRAQPRLEPVALPLSAGGLPVRGSAPGERPPGQARSRVRAARHRSLRRRPLLDRRRALRQGRSAGRADVGPGDQRRSGPGHPARAAHRLVPQHLVLGRRQPSAGSGGDRGRLGRGAPPVPGRARAAGRPGPGRRRAGQRCSARTRRTSSACTAPTGGHAVPEGRHQRPRPVRRAHRQSRTGAGRSARSGTS